jgi:hypothetical protein
MEKPVLISCLTSSAPVLKFFSPSPSQDFRTGCCFCVEHLCPPSLVSLPALGFFFLAGGRAGSHYATQAGLELMILLPQPPEAGIIGVNHHAQLCLWFLF